MPLLRVYIATSLDGYIASPDGGVKWLDAYDSPESDFMGFASQIGAAVFGRKTYDQSLTFGPWMFTGMRCVVMTHRPIPPKDLRHGVEVWNPDQGDMQSLADGLKRSLEPTGKDIWLIGGGESIDALHAAGLIDRWEIFIIPVLLGDGIPLFPKRSRALTSLQLTKTKAYKNGIVELWYEPADAASPSPRTKTARSTSKKSNRKAALKKPNRKAALKR